MTDSGSITLVPTVHYSPRHSDLVRETIREEQPDIVAVELDARRFDRFREGRSIQLRTILEELPPLAAATYAWLYLLQQTVVRLYGFDPNETDMKTAIETAGAADIPVAPIDEPITDVLAELSNRIGLAMGPKLLFRATDVQSRDVFEQFEALVVPFRDVESGEDVEPLIRQFRRYLPEVAEVLIDQRDQAMAERLHRLRADGYDVVAVIGAGHHIGVRDTLQALDGSDADQEVSVPIFDVEPPVTTIEVE